MNGNIVTRKIKFKGGVEPNDILRFTPGMFILFGFVAWYYEHVLEKDCIVTSLDQDRRFRPQSVHHHGRGCDFRVHKLTDYEKTDLVDAVNNQFHYGRGYKCARIHGDDGNEHLHVQVPSNTEMLLEWLTP